MRFHILRGQGTATPHHEAEGGFAEAFAADRARTARRRTHHSPLHG